MSRNVADNDGALSAKQAHAAWLIATGRTRTETAAEVGVDRRTLARWNHEPAFREAVSAHLDELETESSTEARTLRVTSTRVAAAVARRYEVALDDADPETTYQAAVDAGRSQIVTRGAGLTDRTAIEHSGAVQGSGVVFVDAPREVWHERVDQLQAEGRIPEGTAFILPVQASMEEWLAENEAAKRNGTNGDSH